MRPNNMSLSRKRGREETWDSWFPLHLRSEDFWESSASGGQFMSKSDDERVIGDGDKWRWKKGPTGWLRVRGDDNFVICENPTAPQPPAQRIKRIKKAGPSMVPAVQPPDHGARSQEHEETGEGVLFCY